MVTLALQQPDLVSLLQQIAAEQNTTAEELLDAAISEFLDKASRQKIQAESAVFREMHAQLASKYPGEYVAVHDGQVVDHDPDVRTLHLRIRQRYGRLPILLRQVTEAAESQDLVFHSPKLEHGR